MRGGQRLTHAAAKTSRVLEEAARSVGRCIAEEQEILARHWRRMFGDDQRLTLIYEQNILPDPWIGDREIYQFLGLRPRAVEVRVRRTSPQLIERLISKYGEVAAALAGSPHEWMLGETPADA